MANPLLFLQVGHTFEEIARERGDYDVWFKRALVGAQDQDDFVTLRAFDGAALPSHFAYRGIVISGSWSMVTDREPWSEAAAHYLRAAQSAGVPILGVCYGHQLLAHAFGGEVGYNPAGRHAGTADVVTTAAARSDALFSVLPEQLVVQVSHSQRVLALPEGALLLAHTARDPFHAFRLGDRTWAVQFHPEFDPEVSRRYIALRREKILAEGLDPDALIAGVRESDHGARLLARFAEITRWVR
jgi:GMP synthase (glutamine-hydrolysing)